MSAARRARWFAQAVSHRLTLLLGRHFPGAFPHVYVVGCPKSGTTWAGQLVADYLRMPFPRNSWLPIGFGAVIHGHELPDAIPGPALYCVRDGRDVMMSLYFHLYRQIPEGDHPRMPRRLRRVFPGLVNRDRIDENLPAFIEAQAKRPYATRLHWGQHVLRGISCKRERFATVRYEDLLEDAHAALSAALEGLTGETVEADRVRWAVEKYDFARQTGRKHGSEDRGSFLRRGQAGDWRNHFTPEAARAFDAHFGEALIASGYEPDRSWVAQIGRGAPAESPISDRESA